MTLSVVFMVELMFDDQWHGDILAMQEIQDSKGQLVVRIADTVDSDLRGPLSDWLSELINIGKSDDSVISKARLAILATVRAKVIWPFLRILAIQLKDIGWTRRSPKVKWALAGATIGLVAFPGAGAGIAALGGAIGVPLWMVIGGGAMFAQSLYSELAYRMTQDRKD